MDALRRSVETERGGSANDKLHLLSAAAHPSVQRRKIQLESPLDQPQHRPTLYWWRLGWMFVGQRSKGLPEFIQQDGRVDACGSDALTSVAGGYQGDSFMVEWYRRHAALGFDALPLQRVVGVIRWPAA